MSIKSSFTRPCVVTMQTVWLYFLPVAQKEILEWLPPSPFTFIVLKKMQWKWTVIGAAIISYCVPQKRSRYKLLQKVQYLVEIFL